MSTHLSRRHFLRSAASISGTLLLAGTLAACATPATPPASGATPGVAQPAAGMKPEKLTLWTDATFAPDSDDYQTQQIEAWAKNTGMPVPEVTRDPGADVQKKLQAAIESKQLPDISQVDSGRFTLFYPAKIFTDVSDLYTDVGKQWGGFYKPAERIVTKDGKQWAMPYSIDSSLILYRKDLLDAAGVKSIDSWDEFYAGCKQAAKPPDIYPVGFQFNKTGTDAEGTFSMMMYSFGASIVKEDSKTLNIKTPEMLQFLNYAKKTWDDQMYPPGVTSWDNSGNNTALQDGKVIAINNPASPLVWFRANKPNMLKNIGVAAVPKGPKGRFNSAYVRDGFAIMATGSDNRIKLSRSLMQHLYSKDVFRKWIGLAFPAPAVSGMEDHEVWKNPQRAGFLEAAKTGVLDGYPGEPTPAMAELGTTTPVLTMLIRMVVDKWTPEQAMDELDKVARNIYSKHYK